MEEEMAERQKKKLDCF
jgi:hypothetical protein